MKTARQGWQAWLVTLAVAASIGAACAQNTNTSASANATIPAEPTAAPVEPPPSAPAPPRTERGTQKLDESAFRIISERNIFNANRSGGQVRLASRRPVSVETFTLVGTMAYDKGAFAFFEGSRSDYTKALKAGDVIAGHKVADVLTDGVKLEADGKEIELLVGSQMRREDAGAWRMAEVSSGGEIESRSYASSSYSSNRNADSSRSNSRSDRGRSSDYRSRRDRSGDSSSDRTETTAKPAEAAAPSAAEQAAALKRLLERKEKE